MEKQNTRLKKITLLEGSEICQAVQPLRKISSFEGYLLNLVYALLKERQTCLKNNYNTRPLKLAHFVTVHLLLSCSYGISDFL
jgi:hypothetical protein